MKKYNCSFCLAVFTATQSTSKAFCQGCVDRLEKDAAAAMLHRQKILAGDINELPETPSERREVRQAIRKRLTSAPDCQYTDKMSASLKAMERSRP